MYEYYNSSSENNEVDPQTQKKIEKQKKKAEKKEQRKKTWGKIGVGAAVGLAFGIMAGGAFQCVNRLTNMIFPNDSGKVNESSVEVEEDKESEITNIPFNDVKRVEDRGKLTNASSGGDIIAVVDSAMPSVVSITNKSVQQVRSMWGMGVQEYESTSVGSGIIIGKNDEELLIVTNNHVVADANTLTVGFIDDEIYEAYTKGKDADRDLAVVAVKASSLSPDTLSKISVAVMGDSNELRVGEQVVAIGNALGYGQSVTTGIVSALDREVTVEKIKNKLIQTDAAINPGNSGGALLNMRGELIGINSAKFASAAVEGVGYAIPIETVKPIVEDLMNRQTRELLEEADAGYLGITGLNVDSSVSSAYGIPEGVYLQEVADNSPAKAAGLIKGDVVTKFDGSSVKTIAELKEMLLYYAPGEKIKVTYYRSNDGEYEENEIMVTLGDRKGTALDPANKPTQIEDKSSPDNHTEDKKSDEKGADSKSSEDDKKREEFSIGNFSADDLGSLFDFDSIFRR